MSFDVAAIAVIGGGIAGSAACLSLARSGSDPLWIAPKDTSAGRPGEHLAPAAGPLLDDLGVRHLLDRSCHRPAQTMLSAWGQSRLATRDAVVHLEGAGTVLDRSLFDADLAALAVRTQRIAAPLERAQWRDGLWHLQAGGQSFSARFLIDASGRAATVASLHSSRFRADQLAALYTFLDQDPGSDVAPTQASLVETVAEGWWYAALLADGRLALNHFSDPDLLPQHATRDASVLASMLESTRHVGRWIAEAGFLIDAPPALASAATTWIAPAAGQGWLAVGDAAAAFDPLSSHGMTTALWTGARGATAALASLGGDDGPRTDYAARVAAGVQAFLDARQRIYALEWRFAEAPFWLRRSAATAQDSTQP